MSDKWFDVWLITYSGFIHSEHLSRADAQKEFRRLKRNYHEFKGEIKHLPKIGYGNIRVYGYDRIRRYD
jgi:hypothetical protein